jgi:hypothetical protein
LTRVTWFVAAGLLACAANAHAYTRAVGPASQRPTRWEHWPIELQIAESSLPPGISLADATAALTSAIDTWKNGAACAPLRFVVGRTDVDVVADDAVNVVVFRQRAWCKNGSERSGGCYDARRAALTTLHFGGTAHSEHIVGVDIELNAVDFDFRGPESSASNSPKLELSATLSHELGHVLGFGHPCAVPGEHKRSFIDERGAPLMPCDRDALSNADSLLAPSAESTGFGARLGTDDARGVCEVYAPHGSPSLKTSYSCGCNFRDKGRAPWSAVCLALVGVSWLLRCAFRTQLNTDSEAT